MDVTTFLRIERTTKLGCLGERLAEERLIAAGFTSVQNLNRGINFPYADVLASKNGQRYLIGVKSRNEFQDNGKLNPCYNAVLIRNDKKKVLEGLGKTEAQITATLWEGIDEIRGTLAGNTGLDCNRAAAGTGHILGVFRFGVRHPSSKINTNEAS